MIDICILTKPRFKEDIDYSIEWYLLHSEDFNLRNITVYCNFHYEYSYPDDRVIIKRALPYENFHRQKEIYLEYLQSGIPQEGDYIIFCDDDEFFYYDKNVLNMTLSQLLEKFNKKLYKVPEILMSTDSIQDDRWKSPNLMRFCQYRRNDKTGQVKSIIKYSKKYTYDFTTVMNESHLPLHTPSINGKLQNSILYTKNKTKEITTYTDDTSYSLIEYDFPLRLYHYAIKTVSDWNYKIRRGSAASETPWYDKSLYKNIFYGNYKTKETVVYEDYLRRKEIMSKHN